MQLIYLTLTTLSAKYMTDHFGDRLRDFEIVRWALGMGMIFTPALLFAWMGFFDVETVIFLGLAAIFAGVVKWHRHITEDENKARVSKSDPRWDKLRLENAQEVGK